ncbi:MAG: response regulator transcription factor [Gammaproteobacteria bacterium]|nr:response regulator transcription factor [Gammaproteobacteria bacterium]
MALIWLSGGDLGQLSRWSDVLHSLSHESGIVPRASLDGAAHVTADVCVYDLGQRGDADPTHLLHAVRHHASTRFIALTARPAPLEGLTLLRGGVRGYTNRLANPKVIEAVVDSVLTGEIWAGREVTDHLLQMALAQPSQQAVNAGEELLARLTPRETEVAMSVAAGRSNKAIAVDSGVSERTIKAQLNSIFRKTGVQNRVQLAIALSSLAATAKGQRLSSA